MSFDTLGLSDKVVAAVKAVGYTEPTPIQEQAIPLVLAEHDVLGIAQTGTGKTAGFVLPMLTRLEKGRARARMPRTLILEPTRELAAQVEEHFNRYGVNHKLTVALLIGGVSFDEQDKKIMRGTDVLIATPGRLLDHFERGRLLMTGVELVVIDEADRMLDMGFIPDIERIMGLIPVTQQKPRQTLLFSATMPPEISRLAEKFLKNPVRVEVARAASTVDAIAQGLVASGSKPHEKRQMLRALIDGAEGLTNAIIFCNRKRDVATLHRSLEKHGYSVGALHGDMDQHARLRTLEAFRDNKLTLLVASDVAARGLDIPTVSHVFNFDVPTHSEDYVHRIGRTGRAGRKGVATTIATGEDDKYLKAIEKLIGKPIPRLEGIVVPPASDEEIAEDAGRRDRRGERRGRGEERAPRASRDREVRPPREERAARADRSQGDRGQNNRGPSDRDEARQATQRDRDRGNEARADRRPVDRGPSDRDEARPDQRDRGNEPRASRRERGDEMRAGRYERGEQRRYRRDDERDTGPQPLGFGDHVPMFFTRAVRPAKAEEAATAA